MSTRLRLSRVGKKNQPYYRIVVTDRQKPRDGMHLDTVGTYDPRNKDESKHLVINKEKIEKWLKTGATPSNTVSTLLKSVMR